MKPEVKKEVGEGKSVKSENSDKGEVKAQPVVKVIKKKVKAKVEGEAKVEGADG